MPADDLPLERFLVEIAPYPDGGSPAVLTHQARRAADAAGAGGAVRYVRTIYVPEDGSAYLLFEARSAAAIEGALRTVGLEVGSIASAIRVEPDDASRLLGVCADANTDVDARLDGLDLARTSLARQATRREK